MSEKLPKITADPIIHIDATPDDEYPLRILRAYRLNCDVRWESNTRHPLLDQMSADQGKRAKILDRAIALLESDLQVIERTANLFQEPDVRYIKGL